MQHAFSTVVMEVVEALRNEVAHEAANQDGIILTGPKMRKQSESMPAGISSIVVLDMH